MRADQFYLAYGSNLHPLRLIARLPDSQLIGVIELPNCGLRFHKLGQDYSGKCDLIANQIGELSYGALYQLNTGDAQRLDHWERGYQRNSLVIEWAGEQVKAFTYQALSENIKAELAPFEWYWSLVKAGGIFLDLPTPWFDHLHSIPTTQDSDQQRADKHCKLMERLLLFNQGDRGRNKSNSDGSTKDKGNLNRCSRQSGKDNQPHGRLLGWL